MIVVNSDIYPQECLPTSSVTLSLSSIANQSTTIIDVVHLSQLLLLLQLLPIPPLIIQFHQKRPLLYIVCNTRHLIIIIYFILGCKSTPTTHIAMNTLRITIVAVVGGVLGVVLITSILLCVLCIVYYKKRWYIYKVKGTLSYY